MRFLILGLILTIYNGEADGVQDCNSDDRESNSQFWFDSPRKMDFKPAFIKLVFRLSSGAMAILLKSVLQNRTFFKSLLKPSITCRNLTSASEPYKKPLSVLFEEAVGLRPKSETSEIVEEEEGNELKRKLLEMERKLIELKESEPVRKKKHKGKVVVVTQEQTEKRDNLYTLFKGDEEKDMKKNIREREEDVIRVYKELPLEMVSFVKLLHKEGYLNNANFIPGEKLDLGSLDEEYARTFVKFAAERFGKDHQEIAKWLSGSDLKNIVLFGCPSLEKRAIFAAKTLRNFFSGDSTLLDCFLVDINLGFLARLLSEEEFSTSLL